jgi:diadenosine tetraphosphate (Ap4A) HIT family hydrolase
VAPAVAPVYEGAMAAETRRPPASLLLVRGRHGGPPVDERWADSFPGLRVVVVDLDDPKKVAEAARELPQPVALCGWNVGGEVVLEACKHLPPHSVVLVEAAPPAEGILALPCRSLVVSGDESPEEQGTALARAYGSDRLAFPELDEWGLAVDARVRAQIARWLGIERPRRRRVDFDAIRAALDGRCFICETVAANPDFRHELVYEDAGTIAFLNRFPSQLGHVLVAPKEHREQVTGDFGEDEYLALQAVVRRVGEAVRRAVTTERLYVLSLGSQEGNAHVHWHLVPLPPGVPFDRQQLIALGSDCVLDIDAAEMADLAARIRAEIDGP